VAGYAAVAAFTRKFRITSQKVVQILNPGTDKIRLVLLGTGDRYVSVGYSAEWKKAVRPFVGVLRQKADRARPLLGAPAERRSRGIRLGNGWAVSLSFPCGTVLLPLGLLRLAAAFDSPT